MCFSWYPTVQSLQCTTLQWCVRLYLCLWSSRTSNQMLQRITPHASAMAKAHGILGTLFEKERERKKKKRAVNSETTCRSVVPPKVSRQLLWKSSNHLSHLSKSTPTQRKITRPKMMNDNWELRYHQEKWWKYGPHTLKSLTGISLKLIFPINKDTPQKSQSWSWARVTLQSRSLFKKNPLKEPKLAHQEYVRTIIETCYKKVGQL